MDAPEHASPEHLQRIRDAVQSQGFMKLLQVAVHDIAPGHFALRVERRPELLQHAGLFHGGLIATLIDNATTAAAATVARPGWTVLTAEYKLNILSPGTGEQLICRADVVKPGRMLTVVEGRVFSTETNGSGEKLIATALASIANLAPERNRNEAQVA